MKVLRAALAGLAVLAVSVAPTAAHEPTCSEVGFLGIVVHGQHVVRDYVTGGALGGWPPGPGEVGSAVGGSGAALPGGPGPGFHFPNGFAPGASFCNSQSNAPGFHVP
jgi:hypothetical protein